MPQEIERKFLVDHHKWQQLDKPAGQLYRQGYLMADPHKTIRVRLTPDKGFLTLKGIATGISRPEYEYEIPAGEARELLDAFADSELSKIRYRIPYEGKVWEVDVFSGKNAGLIVAEIELDSEDETFEVPAWVMEEVTDQEKYHNSNLAVLPYNTWND